MLTRVWHGNPHKSSDSPMHSSLSFCVCIVLALIAGCAKDESTDTSTVPVVPATRQRSTASVVWFQDEDLRYGLRHQDGRQVLAPMYDDVRPFAEGLAAVNKGAKWVFPGVPDGGEWGYVDESGELVIPIQFQFAGDFSEGLASVSNWSSGEGTMFVDRLGVVQLRIPGFSTRTWSSERRAAGRESRCWPRRAPS